MISQNKYTNDPTLEVGEDDAGNIFIYYNGKLHNPDGPAIIEVLKTCPTTLQSYFLYGKFISYNKWLEYKDNLPLFLWKYYSDPEFAFSMGIDACNNFHS
jgi:hypothetical protein